MWICVTAEHGRQGESLPEPPRISDTELETMINSILKEDDHNKDGYIDYTEFMVSQKR